jgi:hypothetical protein
MTPLTNQTHSQGTVSVRAARAPRDVRRFQRHAAAVILLVPATSIGIARLFQLDDTDTRKPSTWSQPTQTGSSSSPSSATSAS